MVIAELAVKARRNRVNLGSSPWGRRGAACTDDGLSLRFRPIRTADINRRESKEMAGLRYLILTIIDLYWWVIIVQAVMSWLVAFGVINTYNKFVAQVGETLYRLTEPALRPIRNFLPNLGGIDISPIILLLLLGFLRMEIYEYFPV
jgi:YggT family protein